MICRTLADVIAFNAASEREGSALFGQELFEAAEATAGLAPIRPTARALQRVQESADTRGLARPCSRSTASMPWSRPATGPPS